MFSGPKSGQLGTENYMERMQCNGKLGMERSNTDRKYVL